MNTTKGGGLLAFVAHDLPFTEIAIPPHVKQLNTNIKIQIIKINLNSKKSVHISNFYIPPRNLNADHSQEDIAVTEYFRYVLSLESSIIFDDVNAHSQTWHSPTQDHRGQLIETILLESNQFFLNEDTPTRLPNNQNQNATSPDISTINSNLAQITSRQTLHKLSTDHLPIIITINAKEKIFELQQLNVH